MGIDQKVYVCVDDTDDLTKSTSTGSIAEEIGRRVSEEFGAEIHMGITRHQLLLDERVPYTSHNSSMCFDIDLTAGSAARVDEIGWEVIRARRAESSHPGLCILTLPDEDDHIKEVLIRFGQRAKNELVTVKEAEETAAQFSEIILRGEGKTAQGTIGALAGVGLRLSGDDGRFRGKYDLTGIADDPCGTVEQCMEGLNKDRGVEAVFADPDGNVLDVQEQIVLVDGAKAVLKNGRMTFLCTPEDRLWIPHRKDNFNKKRKKRPSCEFFELDPDEEERFYEMERRTCGACLYRRLTGNDYICSAGHDTIV